MSNLSISQPEQAPTALESEQVLLAVRVERTRKALLANLLRSRTAGGLVAGRLLSALRHHGDYSDIILVKNCDQYKGLLQTFLAIFSEQSGAGMPMTEDHESETTRAIYPEHVVQHGNLVQETAFPFAAAAVDDDTLYLMEHIHFLPVFLLGVAESVLASGSTDMDQPENYRLGLRRNCTELKSLRQHMISANTGLVGFVAHKYKANCLSFEDLMQEGLVGLIKAVDRFDPTRGICFSTYAIYWIRQAISRLIVKQDKIVPLPVAVAEKSAVAFEAMRQCYRQNERWPTLAELKACCDLSEQELKLISSYYQATHSLENSGDDDDGWAVMEKMQQSQFAHPLDDLIGNDLACYVDKAVASLPEKQATILTMRFGLKNHTEMTLQAVADQLQVTRERVRQIQNEALKKLKQQFGFDLMLFLEPNDS